MPQAEPLTSVHDHALALVRAGISVVPVARDGSKRPDARHLPHPWDPTQGRERSTWEPLQKRLPTEAELKLWFARPNPPGIGAIGGGVSRGLECLDFDAQAADIFPAWCELVEAEAAGLLARLSIAKTPKPGFHVRYRCSELPIPGNTKLAEDPALPAGERCLIETRGEGGYALVPGCPAECHASGRLYRHHAGPPLHEVATIKAAEREVLIAAARAFDRRPGEEPPPAAGGSSPPGSGGGAGARPGDDYNRRGPDWADLLTAHGWTLASSSGKERRWRRPDKSDGWSATTGVCVSKAHGWELLNVFSSNAPPFGPGTYSRFRCYALLNHGGNFGAATQALAAEGYGQPAAEAQPAREGAAEAAAAGAEAAPPERKTPRPQLIDGQALMAREFPPLRWAVEGIIPEGAALLAGRPKTGKSWLVLNVALAVAGGGVALGKIPVEAGKVLYLALEDGPRRLQSRLRRVLKAQAGVMPAGVTFATAWPRAHEGGLEHIDDWLGANREARLIIVDTVAKFRAPATGRGSAYDEDYAAMGAIQSMALGRSVALLGVTHTRKPKSGGGEEDPLDEVQQSSGMTGAADAVLVLKRPRESKDGRLFITGRDMEERTAGLVFDPEYCLWTLTEGNPNDPDDGLSSEQRRVRRELRKLGHGASPAELGPLVNKAPDATRQLLSRMLRDGLLVRDGYARYALPCHTTSQSHSDVSPGEIPD